jgi:hypothetical protein
MQKLMFMFGLLAFASPMFAADPFAGTWKLNAAQSKYTASALPKDQTIVIEEQGDNLQTTITGTFADGSPISLKYTSPAKGGLGQIQEGPYDAVMVKRINPNTREITYSKGGKMMRVSHGSVSPDGKTLRVRVKGTDLQGKPVAGVMVLDRQ